MKEGISAPVWYCVRQRAGPLVKECRSIRPRLSAGDSPWERAEKNKILRPPRDSSVCRTRVDRLELRLALFGYEGSVYTLTFDREHEPERFQDVRRAWRSFLYRLKKWRGRGFDYVYLIEGRHGDHRYHIHLVLRDSDFSPAEVRHLWRFGSNVDDQPLLRNPHDSYRRIHDLISLLQKIGLQRGVGLLPIPGAAAAAGGMLAGQRWVYPCAGGRAVQGILSHRQRVWSVPVRMVHRVPEASVCGRY